MKKITKLGLSALCGSLAAVSAANAGSIDVTGAAHMTWLNSGDNTVTGAPFGMKTNMSFIGSGELDGGQTFALTIVHNDQAAWSAADIALTTNNIGKFTISAANGGGIGSYDDISPTAWEEVWDAGVSTSINLQKGSGSSTHVSWNTPTIGKGTKLVVAYTPENDGTQNNDKSASGASSNTKGRGYDVLLDIQPDAALSLFAGYSETYQDLGIDQNHTSSKRGHHEEAVAGASWTWGPFSIGGQLSAENMKNRRMEAEAAEVDHYINSSWGVAFNINDGLSLSYGEAASNKVYTPMQNINTNNRFTKKIRQSGNSIQAGYTIGGVTLKYAHTEWDNPGYTEGLAKQAQLLSLGIAF